MSSQKKLIVILGPTASGKTALAIDLAQKYHGEIISADSRQIYKHLNIGTAKPDNQERQKIQHHLIDIVQPDYNFTLADFIKKANYQIRRCQNKGHLPFLVGGTGLYIAAIVNNYNLPKGRIDLGLRKRLSQKNKTELLQYLKELDPATAEVIDQNNPRRLVRALEYVIINQKSFSANQNQTPSPYDILQIGIKTDPEKLNKRITQRTEKMIAAGLIKEVKKITRRYELTLPSLNTIGYQEIGQYLNSEITLDQAITLIKIHTQQYAKRQLTWFKRDPRIKWVKSKTVADKLVNNFLKK